MANVKHHMYGTRTYKSWSEMKQRCGNTKKNIGKILITAKNGKSLKTFIRIWEKEH